MSFRKLCNVVNLLNGHGKIKVFEGSNVEKIELMKMKILGW